MPKLRTLFIHAALAPCRVDLLNYLNRHVELKALFLRANPASQAFDQATLRDRLECDHDYLLGGFEIGGRLFRHNLLRAVSAFDPDVVVTPEYSPTTLSLALIGKRLLHRPWGLTIMTADNRRIARNSGVARKLARRIALSAADSVVAYTEEAKACLVARGVPADRVFIFANRQDEARFAANLDDALPLAERMASDKDLHGKRVVLCVGRLVALKGIDRIIEALARVRPDVPDAVLVVVGDGPQRRRLQQVARREGVADRVRFEGQQQGRDLMAWYLLGHLLVLASESETYGAVVNEALMAGMPVLCSSAAGAAELIYDGYNGHVFDPYDVATLADRMAEWLRSIPPLDGAALLRREGLMPETFEKAARSFVEAIECAAESSHRHAELSYR
jgi:glycosyltransferase involved in cell wall biosynthesis